MGFWWFHMLVVAFLYEQKLRNVGFAQDDAAGSFERSDSNCIFLTVMTAPTRGMKRGRCADDLEVVFIVIGRPWSGPI